MSPDQRFAARNQGHSAPRTPVQALKALGGRFNAGKVGEARIDLIPAVADCNPGLKPVEYNVIIAVAEVAETMGTLGLIKRTEQDRETEQMALQVGRIIDMSPLAFNYDEWKGFEHRKPKVGDIVWFARYAGGLVDAAFDGRPYRIVKDKDIGAVIEPPKVFELD